MPANTSSKLFRRKRLPRAPAPVYSQKSTLIKSSSANSQNTDALTLPRPSPYNSSMADVPEELAWLEGADGLPRPIRGACSIGRSASNQVVLASDKVSRRHALIQIQREKELWLVDFGSRNGTYLNGER